MPEAVATKWNMVELKEHRITRHKVIDNKRYYDFQWQQTGGKKHPYITEKMNSNIKKRKMNIETTITLVMTRAKGLILNVEKGHRLNLPIKGHKIDRYQRESTTCSPNSVFKLEMLMIPEIQEKFIEIISLMPLARELNQPTSDTHVWNAERIRDDCIKKLGKYGFEDFIRKVKDTVFKCKPHKGECILMNNHSYVKMMEVIYTEYFINIQKYFH